MSRDCNTGNCHVTNCKCHVVVYGTCHVSSNCNVTWFASIPVPVTWFTGTVNVNRYLSRINCLCHVVVYGTCHVFYCKCHVLTAVPATWFNCKGQSVPAPVTPLTANVTWLSTVPLIGYGTCHVSNCKCHVVVLPVTVTWSTVNVTWL
jgi:hypothetical protein